MTNQCCPDCGNDTLEIIITYALDFENNVLQVKSDIHCNYCISKWIADDMHSLMLHKKVKVE